MRRCFWIAAVAVAMAAMPAALYANVYASGLAKPDYNQVSYILNENADTNVTVEVWQVGGGMVHSESLGAQAAGTHNWTWNGTGFSAGNTYTVKVKTSDNGYGGWTRINSDTPQNNFYSPRGVDVNRNASSPYFGRIYVVEPVGGLTGASRTTSEGIYILNADNTDAVGQGDIGLKGGLTYGGSNSPYRVTVGPDDGVYVADWSDSNSSLIQGDPDFAVASHILDNTGRAASGLAANHGSISTVYVEGTGVNRKLYTMDEDFNAGGDTTKGGIGSILRYDIGTAATYSGQPAIEYDDGGHGVFKGNIQNYNNDMVRASDGTWWVTQERSGSGTDTLTSLMQISADGTTVLWKSVPSLAANSLTDPLRRTRGLAWDPNGDYLALATFNAGQVLIFDDDTKSIVASITISGAATNRDVAFDAAGNLYIIDNVTERMYVYSPGGGANMFTTESYFTIIPEPATMALLALGGLPLLLRRRR